MKAAANPIFPKTRARLSTWPALAVAVSGGGDSMALLLAIQILHQPHQKLVALTVDHALRKASAAEARQVKAWCAARGIAHVTLRWSHGPITSGIQAKARAARYELMTHWCRKHGFPAVLTAHTKDDQAETVAMRQSRTTSAKSLAGIWPETVVNGIVVLRPLLSRSRKSLRKFLHDNNQPWLEDPSNADPRFERARLRQQGVALKLAEAAQPARQSAQRAATAAKTWAARHVTVDASSMMLFDPKSFYEMTEAEQDAALINLIAAAGGKAPERARRSAHLLWIKNPKPSRRTIGGTIFAARQNRMIVGREPARVDQQPMALSPTKPKRWDNRFWASGPRGSTIMAKSALKSLKRIRNLPAFVDQSQPVILRGSELLATPQFSHHNRAILQLAKK